MNTNYGHTLQSCKLGNNNWRFVRVQETDKNNSSNINKYTQITKNANCGNEGVGGLLWWIFIKFCQSKLADEQSIDNKNRNLFFLMFVNFAIVISLFILFYNEYI